MKNKYSKYPISKNNKQCIGPCYDAHKYTIHPITMNLITSNKPYCPTIIYENEDIVTGKIRRQAVDACNILDKKQNSEQEQEQNQVNYFLNPNINFDPQIFLNTYYKLDSYHEAINWLETKNYLPILNKMRIIECIWLVFHDIVIIEDIIVMNYLDYFKEYHIKDFYNNLFSYIEIINNEIFLKKTKLEKKKFSIERINFMIEKLINIENISNFLHKYHENNKNNNNNINLEEQYNKINIKKNFIEYLLNKLKIK